jgi:hypothetical protein
MNATATIKVTAANLQPGNVIEPPAGEKVWLWRDGVKRLYTVQTVTEGKRTKKGQFVKVNCLCPSPNREEEPFKISCQLLENKLIALR